MRPSSDFLRPRARTVSLSQPQPNAWNAADAQKMPAGSQEQLHLLFPTPIPHSFEFLLFFKDTGLLLPQIPITINICRILKGIPGHKIRALHSLSRLIPARRTCGVRSGGWPAWGHQAGSGGHPTCPSASVSGALAGCCGAVPERRRSCLSPRESPRLPRASF